MSDQKRIVHILVRSYEYEGYEILGVYATKRLANKKLKAEKANKPNMGILEILSEKLYWK